MSFLLGVSYFSPHAVIPTLSKKFKIHIYQTVGKITKAQEKKQKEDRIKAVSSGESVESVISTPEDKLKAFLASEAELPKVVCIENINSFFKVNRIFGKLKFRRSVAGVIIFDNPSNLYDYKIYSMDAERVREGLWWKRKGFLERNLFREVRNHLNDKIKIYKVKPFKRKKYSNSVDGSKKDHVGTKKHKVKVRGYLGHFVQSIMVHIDDGKEKNYIRSLFGFMLGVESKKDYAKSVDKLTKKYGIDSKTIKKLDEYKKTKPGQDLIQTFYHMQRGKSFKLLQREYKALNVDDWLILEEFVNPNNRHKYYQKPV